MTYYRLHINGKPTRCTVRSSELALETRQGFEWIEDTNYTTKCRMTGVRRITGEILNYDRPSSYLADYDVTQPQGMQRARKAWRKAA